MPCSLVQKGTSVNSRVPLVKEGRTQADLAAVVRRRVVGPGVDSSIANISLLDPEEVWRYTETSTVFQLQLKLEFLVAGKLPPSTVSVFDGFGLLRLSVEVTSNGEGSIDSTETGVDGGLLLAKEEALIAKGERLSAHQQVVAHDASTSYSDALDTDRPARIRLDPLAEMSFAGSVAQLTNRRQSDLCSHHPSLNDQPCEGHHCSPCRCRV